MAYSVYHDTTNISDYVVGCPPIPLLSNTWEGKPTLPSMSLTVIANSEEYAQDDFIYFKDGSSNIAWFIIEEIKFNYAENTYNLQLVDSLKLLERVYIDDVVEIAYELASSPADYYIGEVYTGWNQRCFYMSGTTAPHRVLFVQLAHAIKTYIVVAGITTKDHVDISELDGSIDSGFVRWDDTANAEKSIYKQDLCFHPAQIKYAKLMIGNEAKYEHATLLDIVMYALQVLNAIITYSGDDIMLKNRDIGTDPANDNVYAYYTDTVHNLYNWYGLTITYMETWQDARGFNEYITGGLGDETFAEENWEYPESAPTDVRPMKKTWALMNHAVVHWRNVIEQRPYCYEMHMGAYELGSPAWDDYKFGKQYLGILVGRAPSTSEREIWEIYPNPDALGARQLLEKSIDIVNHTMSLEY